MVSFRKITFAVPKYLSTKGSRTLIARVQNVLDLVRGTPNHLRWRLYFWGDGERSKSPPIQTKDALFEKHTLPLPRIVH